MDLDIDLDKVIKGLELCLGSIDSAGCPEACPYYEACQKYENYAVFQPLMRDALELLKAQEPRVMTKKEIIGWDGYIWFEFNGMKAMKTVLIDHGMVREPFRGDYPTKELSWGTCKETWRAWTARPADEQRKAVKWNP